MLMRNADGEDYTGIQIYHCFHILFFLLTFFEPFSPILFLLVVIFRLTFVCFSNSSCASFFFSPTLQPYKLA